MPTYSCHHSYRSSQLCLSSATSAPSQEAYTAAHNTSPALSLTHTNACTLVLPHYYYLSIQSEHAAGPYLPLIHTRPHAHNATFDDDSAVFTVEIQNSFVHTRRDEYFRSGGTKVLLGFYHRITAGMLMTKPNYGGLITATFTKLITAKRRQTLQVIHSVGY